MIPNQLRFLPVFLLMLLCIACTPDERNLKVHVVLHNNQAEKLNEDWKELLLPTKEDDTLIIKAGYLIVSDSFLSYNRPLDWLDELRAKITKVKQLDQIKPSEKAYLDGLSLPLAKGSKDTTFVAIQEQVKKIDSKLVYLALAQSTFDTTYGGVHLRSFSTIDEIKNYLNYQASKDSNYIVISGFDFFRKVVENPNPDSISIESNNSDEISTIVEEATKHDSLLVITEFECPKNRPNIGWLSNDKKSISIKDELPANWYYIVEILSDTKKHIIDAKQYKANESIELPHLSNSYVMRLKIDSGGKFCKYFEYNMAITENRVVNLESCFGLKFY